MAENAVIRVLNLPACGRVGAFCLARVRDQLARVCRELDHEFWSDDISLQDAGCVDMERVRGHNQITDLYLPALAVSRDGCLATFDQAVALSAVAGAERRHLRVI